MISWLQIGGHKDVFREHSRLAGLRELAAGRFLSATGDRFMLGAYLGLLLVLAATYGRQFGSLGVPAPLMQPRNN